MSLLKALETCLTKKRRSCKVFSRNSTFCEVVTCKMLQASLILSLASCLTINSAVSVQKRDAECGTPCNINGESYSDGSTFTLPEYSECFVYQCNDGTASLIEEGCEQDNGTCRAVNETWTLPTSPCVTYQCTKENNTYTKGVASVDCQDQDGACRAHGESWVHNCWTYTCQVTQVGANNYQLAYAISNLRCKDQNDVCRNVLESWNFGCNTYTCYITVVGGQLQMSNQLTGVQCVDANGQCQGVDETFPYDINGTVYNTCSCTISGLNIKYTCQAQ